MAINHSNRARIVVVALWFLCSSTMACITSYLYGGLFAHDRYWKGTIVKVQQIDAALIRNLLLTSDSGNPDFYSVAGMRKLFAPIEGKFLVEITSPGHRTISNIYPGRTRGPLIDSFELANGAQVRIVSYEPPDWNNLFLSWLKAPHNWLSPSYDRLTVPFVFFFIIYSVGFLAFALLLKSEYLEKDVAAALLKIRSGEQR